MKNSALLLLICIGSLFSNHSNAQVSVSIGVNIGSQPEWGPVGYQTVNYYYMPDIECYYYVPRHQFIYLDGGRWIFAASLPARCQSYDLYRGYKVVINDPQPYLRDDVYRARYGRYRECYDRQPILRDCRDCRHDDDDDDQGHGHGRGHAYGHYKKHGHHHDDDED